MNNFNQLSPAETERLAILSEECGEVIQIIGKILRHGYESRNPDTFTDTTKLKTNRNLLEDEIGHIMYSITSMITNTDISLLSLADSENRKKEKIKQYLHHN